MIDAIQMIKDEWRELGFYHDVDDRLSVNQWRFFGSKTGLMNLSKVVRRYANEAENDGVSCEEHFQPYTSLTLETAEVATINEGHILGTLADFQRLSQMIAEKLLHAEPGQTFTIDEYGKHNSLTTRFFVMADDFDPASMDELIGSGRQQIVNDTWEWKKEIITSNPIIRVFLFLEAKRTRGCFPYVIILSKNYQRTCEFYNALFGGGLIKHSGEGRNSGHFEDVGKKFKGHIMQVNNNTYSGGSTIFFGLDDDLDNILPKVEVVGGKVIVPKTLISPSGGHWGIFLDNEENKVILYSSV